MSVPLRTVLTGVEARREAGAGLLMAIPGRYFSLVGSLIRRSIYRGANVAFARMEGLSRQSAAGPNAAAPPPRMDFMLNSPADGPFCEVFGKPKQLLLPGAATHVDQADVISVPLHR